MLRWNLMVVGFLLCIRITVEVKGGGEANSNSGGSISDGKRPSTAIKVSASDDANNNVTSREQQSNTKSPTPKHRTINITDTKNDQEFPTNQTTDGIRRRGKAEVMNLGAVLRGFYVFLGLSVIVIMYFTVRAIRLGRKKTKVKKYGILANREDLEMTPLGAEDEEDDTTVFDLSNHPGQ